MSVERVPRILRNAFRDVVALLRAKTFSEMHHSERAQKHDPMDSFVIQMEVALWKEPAVSQVFFFFSSCFSSLFALPDLTRPPRRSQEHKL